MGWMISVLLILLYTDVKATEILIAAGLFAIAGTISFKKN